jgi:hypothetical protein
VQSVIVMNNWWSCVHSDVLSARGNLFVWIQIFRPMVGLWRMGVGGSKTDRVLSLNRAALYRETGGRRD